MKWAEAHGYDNGAEGYSGEKLDGPSDVSDYLKKLDASGTGSTLGWLFSMFNFGLVSVPALAAGTDTQPTPSSVLPPGSTRVSGRASALLGCGRAQPGHPPAAALRRPHFLTTGMPPHTSKPISVGSLRGSRLANVLLCRVVRSTNLFVAYHTIPARQAQYSDSSRDTLV